MKIKHFLPSATIIIFSSFALLSPPPNPPNVFATFRFGTSVRPVLKYLTTGTFALPGGGMARAFTDSFSTLGDAIVHEGVVVAYDDTIRSLLLKIDTTQSSKLWNGMTELYGSEDSTIVFDSTGWIISASSFSMYYINSKVHFRYIDRDYFTRRKLENIIPSNIDSL